MAIAGARSTGIPVVSLADEILVNRENSTARQPFAKFALQVLSSSAIGSLSDAKQLYPTRADLPAASGLALRFSAVVFADPNGNNNGTWSVQLDNLGDKTWLWSLPLQFSVIRAVDTGAGTANAIQASSNVPVADGILTAFRPFRDSGAGAATVSFNGDDPLTIRDAGGSIVVAASGVKEGVTIAGFRSGAYFDLITDIDAAASAASAAASAELAGTTASTFLSTLDTALTLAVEGATESAGTSATDAETARDLAQKWASHPENSVVADGLYSAFHWAQKAAATVLAGLVDGSVTAAKLASNVVSGLAAKTTLVDADTFLGGDSGDLGKPVKFTVAHVVTAIFNGTRVIANGVFLAASFAWQNAGGFKLTHDVTSLTAHRNAIWPNRSVDLSNVSTIRAVKSAQLTPTLGGLLTFAHGLGVTPPAERLFASIINTSAGPDAGYAVGTEFVVRSDSIGGAAGYGIQVWADASNIYGRVGNSGLAVVLNGGTGSGQLVPTLASWKVYLGVSE